MTSQKEKLLKNVKVILDYNFMDLFRDIEKGKYGKNPKLKKEAKHELKELGGKKRAEKFEKALARKKSK